MFFAVQISVIINQITLSGMFPGQPKDLLKPEIRDKPQYLRGFGYLFYRIQFLEALSLCLCIMILLTLLRHYKPMSHIVNELLGAVPSLIMGTGTWLLS